MTENSVNIMRHNMTSYRLYSCVCVCFRWLVTIYLKVSEVSINSFHSRRERSTDLKLSLL